jgi:hypothetical protein
MASVPLSVEQLEQIATNVAQDLLQEWAINDRFSEENMVQAAQHAVEDTIFVIENYMEQVNNLMMVEAERKNIIN